MDLVLGMAAAAFGTFFVLAGLAKADDLGSWRSAVAGWGLGHRGSRLVVAAVPFTEIGVGVMCYVAPNVGLPRLCGAARRVRRRHRRASSTREGRAMQLLWLNSASELGPGTAIRNAVLALVCGALAVPFAARSVPAILVVALVSLSFTLVAYLTVHRASKEYVT